MKHIKFLFFFILTLFFSNLFLSCSKETGNVNFEKTEILQRNVDTNTHLDVQDNNIIYDDFEESEYIVKSYLDNIPVDGITFNLDSDNWVIVLMKLDDNNNEYVEVRKFTNKEDYMKYGDDNDIPLRKEIEMKAELDNYITTNDIIHYYEINREVPQSYKEFEESLYQKYFGRESNQIQSRNLWIQLFKECKGGSSIPMLHAYAIMPWGWNNKVSAHDVVGIYAGLAVYDKSFFRRHLVTIWRGGFSKMCWNGFTFNNRMSSGIKLL